MNKIEKLKSCPFCGGEASCNNRGLNDKNGNPVWWAECLSCGASIEGTENTKGAAIAAWNKRATENPQPLTLDELIRMDGEPVWIEDKQDGGQWGLVDLNHKTLVWYELPVQAMVLKDGNFYILREYEAYGENLQAYRTKPEGSGEWIKKRYAL